MTIVRLVIAAAILSLLGFATTPASAGDYGGSSGYGDPAPYCEPPPQTCWPHPPGSWEPCGGPNKVECNTGTYCESDDAAPALADGGWGTCKPTNDRSCPPGYDCSCIPPGPRDGTTTELTEECGAYVCTQSRCDSACDCAPGWGCNKGVCEKGHYPSFCCAQVDYQTGPGKETCPQGNRCEFPDGYYGYCPRADICEHHTEKASYHVGNIVDYFNYCHEDTDCAYIDTETSCSWDCPTMINRWEVESAQYYFNKVERKVCSEWSHYGCDYHADQMLQVKACKKIVPRCENYRCVNVPQK